MPSSKEIAEIVKQILKLGIGSVLLLCGVGLLIAGAVIPLEWPAYVISGSVILFAGMVVMVIEIVKEMIVDRKTLKDNSAEIKRLKASVVKDKV